MKYIFLMISLFSCMGLFSQEDYRLIVNDASYEIAADEEYRISINGETVNIMLVLKDTLSYQDEIFSFDYSKEYKPSSMDIDEGIEQVMIMTAEGSGILIQKYSSFNPTMITEMMLSEVTKESLNYGYTMTRNDYTAKLKSGQEIEVIKASLSYKGDSNVYEVASIGSKDQGILIMTMIMNESLSNQGKKIIELMWKSLEYKEIPGLE